MGLFKKQEKVEEMLESYFNLCDECFAQLEVAFEEFFDNGAGKPFEKMVRAIHEREARADDKRRDIELMLYGKALLPESRGDLLGLLESFDGLPNIAETVGFVISSQQQVIPEAFAPRFQELFQVNIEAYQLVRKAVEQLMNNPKVTLHTSRAVDQKESESDHLERELIRSLFAAELDGADRILLKEIVLLFGEISDRAQKVADRIGLISIKRQI